MVSTAVWVVAAVAGCRPYKGVPAGAAALLTAERTPPSGIDTRAVLKLSNGLEVVLEENHAAPVVAIQAWIHAGGANDPAGQEGLAHLFQHLLFLSTKTRPAGPVGRDVADVGGRVGAWTSTDETVFHAVVASAFVDVGLRAVADILTQPSWTPADLENARRAARGDLRQALLDPDRVASQAALATAFAGHSYGRPLLGTETSLAAITADQARRFFDQFYVATNATLVIVGDFDAAAVRAQLATAFGSWTAGTKPAARPRPDEQTAPRVAVFTAQVPTPELVVAFRLPETMLRDLPAVELLAAVLGAAQGGRLEMELARNRQVATAPRAYLFAGHDGGMLITTAVLGPGRVDDATRAVRDEIVRLAHERIGADELARARTLVEGDGAVAKAGLGGYARKLGLSMATAGDPSFEAGYVDRLRKVEADDLMKVAARIFRTPNMIVAVVLPAARDPQRDDRAAKLLPRLRAVAAAPENSAVPSGAGKPLAVAVSGRDVVDYALPSGVRLLVLRDDTAAQVSVRAVWSGGARVDDARLAGATALLARLLPRATKTRGADELANELSTIAGTLDGIAGIDSLGLRGDFLASHWERGLELVVDCARNPLFDDEEIERERRVLLDAIRTRDDDPTRLAVRLFQGALFGRHPYGQDLLGTADSVAGLTRRRLLDHYRRHYGPRGLTLAVLGPVDPDRVAAKVQSLFPDGAAKVGDGDGAGAGDVPRTDPRPVSPPTRAEPLEVFQLIPRAQARIVVGYPGLTTHDPARFALEVLAEILGGPSGRLATDLREQPGLTATLEAISQEGVDPGYFAITAAARPEAVDALVPWLRGQLQRVVEGGVTDAEVFRARRLLIGTRSLVLERRGAVAMAMALHGAFGETGSSYRRDIAELETVTVADVARVARRIIDSRREVLAVVRPRDRDSERSSKSFPIRMAARSAGYTSR